jgi:hypothetical protein
MPSNFDDARQNDFVSPQNLACEENLVVAI